MSPETSNLNKGTSKLFTVPAKEFLTKYQPLTAEELAELGEAPIANAEDLEAQHDTFLKDTFDYWSEGSGAKAKISAETLLPADQNWSTLEKDIDPTKFGEYTLNPDTQHLNFETTKVFIPDLSAFNGKKLSEVAEHLIATYSDKYDIPGLEYWEWLVKRKNLDDLPTGPEFETLKQELKDNYCFFFGSTLRYSTGHWRVPCVNWYGDKWDRNAAWLDDDWRSRSRVVLLAK